MCRKIQAEKTCARRNRWAQINRKEEILRNMRLIFDERPFSWDTEYEIFTESGVKSYQVKNETVSEKLKLVTLFNRNGVEIGRVERRKGFFGGIKYLLFFGEEQIGEVVRDDSYRKTRYVLKLNNAKYRMFGLILSWDFDILDDGAIIMHAGTDGTPYLNKGKYVMDIYYENSESYILLACLGLEAANHELHLEEMKKLEKKMKK